MARIHEFSVKRIDGTETTLADYAGKAMLIVNVASQCGFTPQYTGLEALHRKYADRGLVVLGFPCNQFGHQEPGDEAEIQKFCKLTYDVSFPLFAKIDVNGEHTHPLYAYLKKEEKGLLGTEAIKWNFTKFLVGKDGAVLDRFGPRDTPEAIETKIAKAL